MITAEILVSLGVSSSRAKMYVDGINSTMKQYRIDENKLRMQHFLAQILHESGRLIYNKELASGAAYEGRKDLGNTDSGDGIRFKGRGFIQITGRANYTSIAKDFAIDCINHPEMLEQTPYCALTAGWFWNKRGLNAFADKDDVTTITKRVNGGLNGFDDRKHILELARKLI